MTQWCIFCAQAGRGNVVATCTVDGDTACPYCGEREAKAVGCMPVALQRPAAVTTLGGAVASPPPVRPKAPVESRRIAGEPVMMSTHAVIGPEMIAPAARASKPRVGDLPKPGRVREIVREQAGKMSEERRVPVEVQRAILAEPETAAHAELARKYDLSDLVIAKIRRSAGMYCPGPGRRRGAMVEDEQIEADVRAGMTVMAIANKYGVSRGVVTRVIERRGLEDLRVTGRRCAKAEEPVFALGGAVPTAAPVIVGECCTGYALPKDLAERFKQNAATSSGGVRVHFHFDASGWNQEKAEAFLEFIVPRLRAIAKAVEA